MSSTSATSDRPLLGIMLMLGFCFMAPLGDSIAKFLGQSWGIVPLLFVRFLVQLVLLLPIVLINKTPWQMSPRLWRIAFFRVLLHIGGVALMFEALRHMPLAETLAIAFVMPFMILLMGKFFLNETVGMRRLSACIVGFIGTLLVIQPTFAVVGPVALYPLGVAFIFALFMLTTRQLAKDTDPIGLQMVSGGIATLLILPVFLLIGSRGIPAAFPTLDLALLVFMGLNGTVAHLLMTWSLRYAPSATLAPMQYLEIPFGTLIGWLMFQDFPNGLALAGIGITIGAGLYVIARERATSLQEAQLSRDPASRAAE